MAGTWLKSISTLPVVVIAIVAELYLLVNGTAVFGAAFQGYQNIIEIYLLLLAGIFFASFILHSQLPVEKLGVGMFGLLFVPSFLLTFFLLDNVGVPNIINAKTLTLQQIVLQIIFQIFVVAFSEEMIFRGYLQQVIFPKFNVRKTAFIWQGILFGAFHYAAYSGLYGFTWISIFEAMVFGIMLGAIILMFQSFGKGYEGLGVTWGIHSAYNLALTTGLFAVGGLI